MYPSMKMCIFMDENITGLVSSTKRYNFVDETTTELSSSTN